MKKNLLLLSVMALTIFMTIVSNAQTNLLKNGNMETQGAWQTLDIWYAPDIAPIDMDFGYNSNVPKSGSGKCFHVDGTYNANSSWNEIKAGIWQPILLKKGHTYKVTGAFKDNSSAPIDAANWEIWAEIHFYYTPPLTGKSKTDSVLPYPSAYLYAFNSWNNINALGMDGTFQDSACCYGLGAAGKTDTSSARPYYTVPDSIFASGKDTVTLYFACQFGMTSNSADNFDFTIDEFSVTDSGQSGAIVGRAIETSFNIYPNPVINELKINNSTRVTSVQIFSITGQRLKSAVGNDITSGINVSDLKEGMYILHINSNNGQTVSKFIKR